MINSHHRIDQTGTRRVQVWLFQATGLHRARMACSCLGTSGQDMHRFSV